MLNWKEPSIYFESITKVRLLRFHTHTRIPSQPRCVTESTESVHDVVTSKNTKLNRSTSQKKILYFISMRKLKLFFEMFLKIDWKWLCPPFWCEVFFHPSHKTFRNILGRIMFILCMIVLLDVIMFSRKVVIPTYIKVYNLRYCFVTGIDVALFYNLWASCFLLSKNSNTNQRFEIDITYAKYSTVNKSWLSCSQGDLLWQEQNFAVNCENQCTVLRIIQWILLHTCNQIKPHWLNTKVAFINYFKTNMY